MEEERRGKRSERPNRRDRMSINEHEMKVLWGSRFC